MNPLSATRKILRMSGELIRHPQELPYAPRWFHSMLPGHSPLQDETPWITFRAIDWLDAFLKPDMDVFEYGAGGSTLYLAKRARRVVSVEHDEGFHKPPHEDIPEIQPVGCFHPTFTGTGFDMDHVSLAAVRLVVSTLCSGQEGIYPDFDWDVGVVDLWDEKKTPIEPCWTTYPLTRHPNCKAHE